ncbi:MAG TPA: hypothetical protein VIG32_06270 [Candidatus Baltobacteraceae bacterium]|jgi:hypothetical protein
MRKVSWRAIGWLAALALGIFVAVQVMLAGRENIPLPGSQPIVLKNCQEIAHHLNSESWRFTCARAEVTPDGSVATIENITDGVLFKKGKPYLRLSAKRVQINTTTLDFTATGDVHVVQIGQTAGDRRSFDTDLVQWTNVTKLLTLPHPSIVRSGEQTLKVQTIAVDFAKGQIRLGKISGGVHVPN